jgi:intracellular sulfur oxidation DsrE/DsrF family protein
MKSSKSFTTLAAVALLGASLVGCNSYKPAKNGYNQQKVVYHINNLQTANGALRNVKNHLNALGDENAEIIVVTHSSGAFAMVDGTKDKKGNSFESTIQKLANRGVKFTICANTIRGKKINKNKINLNAKVIPSGVAEVAHLQQKGYLYVKP